MKRIVTGAWVLMALLLSSNEAIAQCIFNGESYVVVGTNDPCPNTIQTAVPFLGIVADARSGALGDAGLATSADATAINFNDSKLVFAEQDFSASASYTPWFQALGVTDMFLANVTAFKKIDDIQAIGGGIRFFSYGQVDFTDTDGNPIGSGNPQEFEVKFSYSRKLSDNFSAGIGGKYIYSNLAAQQVVNGQEIKVGQSGAVDLSFTYNNDIKLGDKDANLTVAMAATNIGGKMTYTAERNDDRDYLPANLGIGVGLDVDLDDYNSLALVADFNKLMVPTPCISTPDTSCDTDPADGIPDWKQYSPISAIFKSFGDAPNGFSEELREISTSVGLEYKYDDIFAVRLGYHYLSPTKGDQQYFTAGAGIRWSIMEFNFSWLGAISQLQNNPLNNTLRFTMLFNFGEDVDGVN